MAENNFNALVQLIVDKAQARNALQRELKELQREAQLETDIKINLSDVRQARNEIAKANREQQEGTRENIKLRAQELAHARMLAKETKVATDLEVANRQREMKLTNQAVSEELAGRKRVAQEQKIATQEEITSRENIRKINEQTFREESSARKRAIAETKLQAQEQRALQSTLNVPEKEISRKLKNESYSTDISKMEKDFQKYGLTVDEAKSKTSELTRLLNEMNNGLSGKALVEKANEWEKAFSDVKVQLDKVKLSYDNIEEVNKIQLSFDNGHGDSDYQNRITAITNELTKYGLSVDEVNQKTENLRTILKGFKVDGEFLPDEQLVAQANKLEAEFKAVKVSVDSAKLSYDKFLQPVSNEKTSSLIVRINSFLTKNTAITAEAKAELQSFVAQLNNGVNLGEWNKFNSRLKEIEVEMRQAGKLGKSFTQTFKDSAKSFIEWTTASGAVMEVVQGFRYMYDAVLDIDTAMTNLYKVTDETSDRYNRFLESACDNAQRLGRTVSSLVEQTSNWSKLGYSLDEAEKLAQISSIYANVGEVDDYTAVSDMVTAMKANINAFVYRNMHIENI